LVGADVGKGRGAHLLRTLLNLDISQSQRLRMITVLLDHHASPSNAQDDLNITPAALAAQLGNLSIVQLLSSVGVDLDETPAGQQPPIYYAAVHGRVEIVRTLVAWGVRMPEQLSGFEQTGIKIMDTHGGGENNILQAQILQASSTSCKRLPAALLLHHRAITLIHAPSTTPLVAPRKPPRTLTSKSRKRSRNNSSRSSRNSNKSLQRASPKTMSKRLF